MLDPKGRVYETIPKIAEHFEHVRREVPSDSAASSGAPPGVSELFYVGKGEDLMPKVDFAKEP